MINKYIAKLCFEKKKTMKVRVWKQKGESAYKTQKEENFAR